MMMTKAPVCAEELDLALELGIFDDTRAYEGIEDGAHTDHHLVVRRVHGELFGL